MKKFLLGLNSAKERSESLTGINRNTQVENSFLMDKCSYKIKWTRFRIIMVATMAFNITLDLAKIILWTFLMSSGVIYSIG